MELVFIDDGANGRHFGDLVTDRFGVIALEVLTALPALERLALDHLAKLFGRNQGANTTAVTGLPAPPRFLPEGGAGGRRLTEGGSEEGGLEELVEFLLTRSSKVAFRCSSERTSARTAACA